MLNLEPSSEVLWEKCIYLFQIQVTLLLHSREQDYNVGKLTDRQIVIYADVDKRWISFHHGQKEHFDHIYLKIEGAVAFISSIMNTH